MTFDPEQIETELAEIQKRSSPTEARTVILNLLVVSDEESRPRAEQALGAVLGKRAARVIHIVDGQRGESDISLSARCYLDHERKSVCFQEVLIENGSDGVGAAPGSWTPLLIRDIPVYVLWLASFGPRPALLDHVQEQADKLIIDSEYAVAAGDTTGEIFGAVSGVMLPEGFRVSDLTWQRTLPLRRVTAHTFDPEEHARALFDLESVELSGAPPMFAALYLGWIASRLGWQAGEDDGRSSTGGEADSAGGGTRGGAGSPRPGGGRGESSGGGGTPAGSGDNPGGAGRGDTRGGAGNPGGGGDNLGDAGRADTRGGTGSPGRGEPRGDTDNPAAGGDAEPRGDADNPGGGGGPGPRGGTGSPRPGGGGAGNPGRGGREPRGDADNPAAGTGPPGDDGTPGALPRRDAGNPGGAAGAPGDGALPGAGRAYLDRQGRAVQTLHREPATLEERISVTFRFFEREPIGLSAEPGGCVSVSGTGAELPCEVFNVAADGEMLLGEIDAARNEGLYLAAFEAAWSGN